MSKELKQTLPAVFGKSFRVFSDRPALTHDDITLTYGELAEEVYKCANAFQNLGVSYNMRVALFLPNSIEYVVALLGAWFAGGARVALNHMLGPEDVEYNIRDSEASVLVIHEEYLDDNLLDRARDIPTLHHIVVVGDAEATPGTLAWSDLISDSTPTPAVNGIEEDMLASLAYTGGTTGRPKGVISTQRGAYFTTLSVILEEDVIESDRMLLITPLPHAAGLQLMAGLAKGAHVILENKFDVARTLDLIERHSITFTSLVPTMIYRLIDYMKESGRRVSSLRTIAYGTAPITSSRLEEALELFGSVFVQSYGMTESPGSATRLTKTDHALGLTEVDRLASCGTETMFSSVKIVNDKLEELPSGESGEILIKSYTNMAGYHNLPEQTDEVLIDGWLRTGDVGMKDEDGYLFLLDRKKDMIISGGLNVYSAEVENVLSRAPGVRQVAVIGTPHEDWGEVVTAVIVVEETFNEDEFSQYYKQRLTGYKQPKVVDIREELPLTNYGKIDKKALRVPFWSDHERSIS